MPRTYPKWGSKIELARHHRGLVHGWPVRFVTFVLLGACATGTRADQAPDAGGQGPRPDAPEGSEPDAPDNPPPLDAPGPAAAALLITEVVLAPTTGELVEIVNPTAQTVDLSTYYLTDSGKYFRLPGGTVAVDSSDFIVKFPAGATIAPGAVITVALDTVANFQTLYGAAPTFSVASGTMTAVATSGLATLTNAGEPVILFSWDGVGLARDVDILLAGVPSAANQLEAKSGVVVAGSAYATDARTIAPQASAPNAGASTKRIALETGNEVQTGSGNGIAGDDETSENTASTWDTTFTAPTPGTLPAGLL